MEPAQALINPTNADTIIDHPQSNEEALAVSEHVSAVEMEIRAYNTQFGRLLATSISDEGVATRNIHMLQNVADVFHSKASRDERLHAMAIMYLILTLPITQTGPLQGNHLRMAARIKRLAFIDTLNTQCTIASETWPERRGRGLLREALDMYHQSVPERMWWSAAHEWIRKVLIIREHLHADTIDLFLGIILGSSHMHSRASEHK